MRPLALVGNLSHDRVDGGPPRIGGAPFYAAAALRLTGTRAHVVAKCADADRRAFGRALTALGAQVTLLRADETTAFAIAYRGEEREMAVDAVGPSWAPADVDAVPAGGWTHVAPLLRGDFDVETLAALARGRRVLLDGQGLVRARSTGALVVDGDFERELLQHVTALKLSEEEAAVVGDVDVPELVVTRGSLGSRVHVGGRTIEVQALPIRDVEPTGSGDAFAAAYAAGRADGHSPASAARRATAVVAALLTRRRR